MSTPEGGRRYGVPLETRVWRRGESLLVTGRQATLELSQVAADVFLAIGDGATLQSLVEGLGRIYDVPEDVRRRDAQDVIAALVEAEAVIALGQADDDSLRSRRTRTSAVISTGAYMLASETIVKDAGNLGRAQGRRADVPVSRYDF